MNIYPKELAKISMFSAASVVLSFLGFNLPFAPFLKIDFSETPALLAGFLTGPSGAILVLLIKNLILLPFTKTASVGEFSNFILGCAFVIPAALCFKKCKSALFGSFMGILCVSIVSVALNYFVLYPMYFTIVEKNSVLKLYGSLFPWIKNLLGAVLMVNLPLTVIKSAFSAISAILIMKQLLKTKHFASAHL
ncbi:MAG: ECF transporter S component [Oscillospiraceae bacterium]|nr:ECF transporter S component [Oscillospiraceae bacterium]